MDQYDNDNDAFKLVEPSNGAVVGRLVEADQDGKIAGFRFVQNSSDVVAHHYRQHFAWYRTQ